MVKSLVWCVFRFWRQSWPYLHTWRTKQGPYWRRLELTWPYAV